MKDKSDPLPLFLHANKCLANADGGHEPLMNASYDDKEMSVTLVGSYLGTWENGSLEIRVCKHCQLLYALPIKYEDMQQQ